MSINGSVGILVRDDRAKEILKQEVCPEMRKKLGLILLVALFSNIEPFIATYSRFLKNSVRE